LPRPQQSYKERQVNIIQKGYGEVKLPDGEKLQGEITLYAEGWLAVTPVRADEQDGARWFPREKIAELAWRKSIAVRRPE
jgi:hypothetical protein